MWIACEWAQLQPVLRTDRGPRPASLLNDATNNTEVQQSLVTQAKDLRQQYQGVSLDEEATTLMQFQRAYQANAKFLTVLDQLTQTAIDILQA